MQSTVLRPNSERLNLFCNIFIDSQHERKILLSLTTTMEYNIYISKNINWIFDQRHSFNSELFLNSSLVLNSIMIVSEKYKFKN